MQYTTSAWHYAGLTKQSPEDWFHFRTVIASSTNSFVLKLLALCEITAKSIDLAICHVKDKVTRLVVQQQLLRLRLFFYVWDDSSVLVCLEHIGHMLCTTMLSSCCNY